MLGATQTLPRVLKENTCQRFSWQYSSMAEHSEVIWSFGQLRLMQFAPTAWTSVTDILNTDIANLWGVVCGTIAAVSTNFAGKWQIAAKHGTAWQLWTAAACVASKISAIVQSKAFAM